MSTIGDKIRVARESARMTQTELGKACGTTKQTIYKYETGAITNIPMDRLADIAEALNITVEYLMGWDNPSEAKRKMLKLWDSASESQQRRIIDIMEYVLSQAE